MIPDYLLERLHLGELSPQEAQAVRARLGPSDHARLAQLAADDAATLAALPPVVVADEVQRRLNAAAPRRRPLVGPLLATAGLAAVVATVWLGQGSPTGPSPAVEAPTERAKGDPRLLVFRRGASEAELLLDEDEVQAGDELQLALLVDEALHVAVLSLDGRGAVTVHRPPGLLAPGRHVLDHAFMLDDAPEFERFWLVAAPEPIKLDPLKAAAQAVGRGAEPDLTPLDLPEAWQQWSTVLRKEEINR